jgi:cysteine desulfurase / selenocysteine lyase
LRRDADSVYLDNAATTYPKPEQVYLAAERFMREVGGSAGRSGHRRAVETGRAVYAARESLARLLGAGDPLRIAFTKNATEAINMVIWGLLKRGDHVVTSSVEHNSVMRPLHAAASRGINHTVVTCGPDGSLDVARLEREIRPETALVIVNHASNVAGTILPVVEVAQLARERCIPLLVDAAQTAGRLPIAVESDGIDMLAFTGHKELFGLQGTGGLYVREGLEVTPVCFGGTGSSSSSLEQPDRMPDRLESGTLNAHGIAGLGAGVEFVLSEGVDRIRAHELELTGRLLEGLEGLKGARTYGPSALEDRVGVVPVTFDRMWPPDAAEALDSRYGIATRPGMHCSPLAHRTIGTAETGVLRVSFSYLNTAADVDYLLESLGELLES